MKTKHTAAPWKTNLIPFFDFGNDVRITVTADTIGEFPTSCPAIIFGKTREEAQANAKLIAAAPELLEALQFCKSVIESGGMFDMSERLAFSKASEAIKKATE